jgi:hypothetical protein
LEAEFDLARAIEAAQKQPSADQEHQRQRHLNNNQRATKKCARFTRSSASTCLDRCVQIRARRHDGRRKAGHDAGEHHQQERRSKHTRIEAEIGSYRRNGGHRRQALRHEIQGASGNR